MTTIIWIIIAIVMIFLIILILLERNKVKLEEKKISFKESIDLTNLPIVTFLIGERKLNFILDTGSNISYINKEVIDNNQVPYKKIEGSLNYFGIEGNSNELEVVILALSYKGGQFPNAFGVGDFSIAFEKLKQQEGVIVHGILGCDFFEKYKYVIDFAELKAYPK